MSAAIPAEGTDAGLSWVPSHPGPDPSQIPPIINAAGPGSRTGWAGIPATWLSRSRRDPHASHTRFRGGFFSTLTRPRPKGQVHHPPISFSCHRRLRRSSGAPSMPSSRPSSFDPKIPNTASMFTPKAKRNLVLLPPSPRLRAASGRRPLLTEL
jgi:hypothetical protein